uniref:Uncharacterized protein n=1 Tax=Oryza barthii TaxID=65489 RepID=A0A0D3F3Q0_9ORYZ
MAGKEAGEDDSADEIERGTAVDGFSGPRSGSRRGLRTGADLLYGSTPATSSTPSPYLHRHSVLTGGTSSLLPPLPPAVRDNKIRHSGLFADRNNKIRHMRQAHDMADVEPVKLVRGEGRHQATPFSIATTTSSSHCSSSLRGCQLPFHLSATSTSQTRGYAAAGRKAKAVSESEDEDEDDEFEAMGSDGEFDDDLEDFDDDDEVSGFEDDDDDCKPAKKRGRH